MRPVLRRLSRPLSRWALWLLGALACAAGPAAAQVGVLGSDKNSVNSPTSTSLTLARPAASGSNVLLVATVAVRGGSGVTFAPPTGWTLVQRQDAGTSVALATYRRLVASLAAEPASYSFGFTAERASGVIVALSGADTVNPVPVVGASAQSGSVSSISAPSVMVPVADTRLLAVYAALAAGTGIGTPAAMTLLNSAGTNGGGSGIVTAMFTQSPLAAGASGVRTATVSPANPAVAVLLAVQPAQPPVTLPLYLDATGVPGSTFSAVVPTGTLANHDPGRDGAAGLLIARGGSGAGETDPGKHQRWLSGTGGITLSGALQLRFWSAMKDFDRTKRGIVTAFLRDCDGSGASCTLITSATLNVAAWGAPSPSWVERTIDFPTVNHSVAAGRSLELKLIVADGAEDDMWFAYDAAAQPSVLRVAVATVNHYQVSLPANALACQAATVTVTACADAGSPCTNPVTTIAGATASLATSAGTLGSGTLTFNTGGVATTTLSHAAAADGAGVAVTLSAESVVATAARRCCPDGTACAAANSCSTTFSTAGFIVAATAGGAAATVPAQTAGTGSGAYVLRAVRSNTTTRACEAALSGAQSVQWALQCLDPGSCSSGSRMTLTGSAAVAIAGNPAGGVTSTTAVPMSFDAEGNAPFSFAYQDAGQVRLHASRAAGGGVLTALAGSSNAFVVRPAGFQLSGIRCTSYAAGACATAALASPGHNPGATSATGTAFMPAGAAFSATVTALTSSGKAKADAGTAVDCAAVPTDCTPNFGRETVAAGVTLAHTLLAPAGGTAGTLSGSFGGFSNGVASGSGFSFSEVGAIRLTPSVAGGSYLGAGNVTGTASGAVGRFTPARFVAGAGSVVHRVSRSCSPASTFSYLGENFRLALTLTAQNAAGATTANYQGAFAKFDPTQAGAWQLAGVASDGSTTTAFGTGNGRLSLGSATGSWSAGVLAGATLTASALRGTAPEGPHAAAFGIAPVDSDGVALAAPDLAVTAPYSSPDRTRVATVALRHGRLVLTSAIGPADRPLALPVTAQAWNGSAWATHTLDSCSTVPAAAVSFGQLGGALTAADAAVAAPVALAAGRGSLRLAAPGGGRRGALSLALSLGSGAADASCLQPWTPASGRAATAGAQLPALRAAWCGGSGADKDPAARAVFGRASGNEHLVFRQERY